MSGTNPDMSLPPFVMPPQTNYATHPMPSPSLYGTSSLHPQPTNSDMFSSTTTSVSPYPSPHSMFDVNPLSHPPPPSVSPVNNTNSNTPRMMSPMVEPTDQLVAYYFEHVRKLQFAFAGQELTQVLYLVSTLSSSSSSSVLLGIIPSCPVCVHVRMTSSHMCLASLRPWLSINCSHPHNEQFVRSNRIDIDWHICLLHHALTIAISYHLSTITKQNELTNYFSHP